MDNNQASSDIDRKAEVMTLADFAEKNRLKLKRGDRGDVIILGKQGHLYEYSASELGVMFMPPRTESEPWGRWCPKIWGNFKRAAAAAGMTLRQNGDSEGCLSFDPKNNEQAKLAIKIAKVRPKRQPTPDQVARFLAAIQNARFKALDVNVRANTPLTDLIRSGFAAFTTIDGMPTRARFLADRLGCQMEEL